MSARNKGGASLRLVTGLTAAALIVSGVIAANLLPVHHRVVGCTFSGRSSSASSVLAGDVVKVFCNGLNTSTSYQLYSPSSLTGWATTGRGASTGVDPTNAMAFTNTGSNDYAKSGSNSYTYQTGSLQTSFTIYILVPPSASGSLSSLNLKPVGQADVLTNLTPPSLTAQSAMVWNVNPVTGGSASNLSVTGLVTNESYKFKVDPSSTNTGWPNQNFSAGGTGTSGSHFAGNAGLATPSGSSPFYFDTVSLGMGNTNSDAGVALCDTDGNVIQSYTDQSATKLTIQN